MRARARKHKQIKEENKKTGELTCCGLIIFVSGSSRDSLQCAKYPAIRGIANKTVKNSVGNPIALINVNLVPSYQLCSLREIQDII